MEKLEIQSPAFATGAPIPKEFTQQGSDMSPPLDITNIPKGTQSLVLVCVDPDAPDPEAPKLTFVHWVAYNLPAQQLSIPEGADLESVDVRGGHVGGVVQQLVVRAGAFFQWVGHAAALGKGCGRVIQCCQQNGDKRHVIA